MVINIFSRSVKDRGALYLQIAAGLRRSITQGSYSPGDCLPSLQEMALEFDVSVVTVRTAVAILEEEGLLERKQGKGTFVSGTAISGKSLVFDTGFGSLLAHLKGKSAKVLKAVDGPLLPMVSSKVGQLDGPYHFMRRVHSTEDTPYALINIHIRKDIYLQHKEQFDREMVIPILADMPELIGGQMHQNISFTTADPETAQQLDLPINAAVGDVQRIMTDAKGSVLYVGNTKYRGDFVNLEINFDLNKDDLG